MNTIDLGLIPYKEAEQIQLATLSRVQEGSENTLFLLEHPPVITLGKNGGRENLHVTDDFLLDNGIALVQATRGGNITCHFPGQLVAYPICRIEKRKGGIKAFFRDMEEAVIRTLDHFGISAQRITGKPGVFVGQDKICSMGIGVKKWVTYHGLALNIQDDLSLFDCITLCGLTGTKPTSMSRQLGRSMDVQEVKDVFTKKFKELFQDS